MRNLTKPNKLGNYNVVCRFTCARLCPQGYNKGIGSEE